MWLKYNFYELSLFCPTRGVNLLIVVVTTTQAGSTVHHDMHIRTYLIASSRGQGVAGNISGGPDAGGRHKLVEHCHLGIIMGGTNGGRERKCKSDYQFCHACRYVFTSMELCCELKSFYLVRSVPWIGGNSV